MPFLGDWRFVNEYVPTCVERCRSGSISYTFSGNLSYTPNGDSSKWVLSLVVLSLALLWQFDLPGNHLRGGLSVFVYWFVLVHASMPASM